MEGVERMAVTNSSQIPPSRIPPNAHPQRVVAASQRGLAQKLNRGLKAHAGKRIGVGVHGDAVEAAELARSGLHGGEGGVSGRMDFFSCRTM